MWERERGVLPTNYTSDSGLHAEYSAITFTTVYLCAGLSSSVVELLDLVSDKAGFSTVFDYITHNNTSQALETRTCKWLSKLGYTRAK